MNWSTVLAVGLIAPLAMAQDKPVTPQPKDVALVVGIEQYFVISRVKGAKQNALDWRDFLRSRGVTTFELIDREATNTDMLATAKKVAAEAKPGTRVWFIYIGHGAPLPKVGPDGKLTDPEAGLVAVDAQQNANSLVSRSVSLPAMLAELNKGQQKETVAIIDACFSGNTPSGAIVPDLQPLIAIKPKVDARVVQLSAGRSDEFAGPLPGYGRPAFSYLVLGAMKGWGDANADGVVTSREAVDYAQSVLNRVLKDRSQNPELLGDDVQLAASLGEQGPTLDEFQRKAQESDALSVSADGKVVNTGRRTAGYVFIGGGAAVGLGAIILGQVAAGTARASNSAQGASEANAKFAEAKSLALVTDIGLGVGIAAAATGLILVLTSTSDGMAVAPWVSSRSAGVSVGARF